MRSLVGFWKGFYEYGVGYQLPYFAGRVEFELVLTGTNNKLFGNCTEIESEISDNMKSEIEGFFEEGIISFRKIYAHTHIIDNSGERSVELNKEAVVFYTGQYDSENDCLYGFWEYSAEANGIIDDERFSNTGGIWKCIRIE